MAIVRALLPVIAAAALGSLAIGPATAQIYPTRPITIIVPFPAGTTSDLIVRFLADQMTAKLGQSVIVDHRPGGAGGTVGAKTVASAAADGHTLLLTSPGALVVAPLLYKGIGY